MNAQNAQRMPALVAMMNAQRMSDPIGARIEIVTERGSLVMFFHKEFTEDQIFQIAQSAQKAVAELGIPLGEYTL